MCLKGPLSEECHCNNRLHDVISVGLGLGTVAVLAFQEQLNKEVSLLIQFKH